MSSPVPYRYLPRPAPPPPDPQMAQLRVLLDPYFPTVELENRFEDRMPYLARIPCLGNLPSYDHVFRLKLLPLSAEMWRDTLKLPKVADKRVAELLFELQISRSVQGFERKMEVTQRTISVAEERTPEVRRRGLLARLFGWGGKPEEEEV